MLELELPDGKTVTMAVLMLLLITMAVGAVQMTLTTHPVTEAEDLDTRGIIEDVGAEREYGDDLLHVALAGDVVPSVSLYLYNDEGYELKAVKHVYTGQTVVLEDEDYTDGSRHRLAAVAPNGTVVGSATFTWQERREPNE